MLPIKYITENNRDEQWELTVCSVGCQNILPNESYPPKNHENEYIFTPDKGRVIDEYQMLYIVEGSGVLATSSCRQVQIKAGYVFLLFPGEWHTQPFFIAFCQTVAPRCVFRCCHAVPVCGLLP